MAPLIVHIVSNDCFGGGERYALDLAKRLRGENRRVLFICKHAEVGKVYSAQGFTVLYAWLKGFCDLLTPVKLRRMLQGEKEVIIHAHNFKDAFTACVLKTLRANVKVIVTRHLVRKAKNNALHRFVYKNVDTVVFVSELAKNDFNSAPNSLPTEKQTVILNSIADDCQPVGDIPPCLKNPTEPIIMYHGRLAEEKGLEVLLNAVAEIPLPFRLTLVGSGDDAYVEHLQQMVKASGLQGKVEFTGFRSDAAYLTQFAAFGVLPTVASEACGLSNMEYMRSGKVQVCTSNGAQKEYLRDGETAFLVAPNDEAALKEKITYLLEHPHECQLMGERAKRCFDDHLGFDAFFKKMMDIYIM